MSDHDSYSDIEFRRRLPLLVFTVLGRVKNEEAWSPDKPEERIKWITSG